MTVNVNDILIMKKQHPCGSFEFKVQHIGINLTLKCMNCGRETTVNRFKILKNVKKISKGGSDNV